MSTKLDPGSYDCYAKLEPDEPYYLLMGRSRIAPLLVRMELMTRRWEIIQGTRPDTPEEHAQISEGFKCLTEMEIWYRDKRAKSALNALEFDHLGHPITGQHSRKINSTTSGANES